MKTTIIFQGDSITDASRCLQISVPNAGAALGSGYCGMIAARLLGAQPQKNFEFFNRGISGNKVPDLLARWRPDALNLAPDWISILIGVNDTWHKFATNTGTSLDLYEKVYRLLLESTVLELPKIRLILCEPFALKCDAFKQEWLDEIRQRALIVQKLAREFNATFVPFQGLFESLTVDAPVEYWLPDGVHPSPGGHFRMALFWLEKVMETEAAQ